MAATVKKQMWFYSSDDGVAPNTDTVQIAGSMGLPIAGTPMVQAADGYWDIVATDGVLCHGFLAETILVEKAEGDKVRIVRGNAKHVYAIYCESAGTDSAVVQSDVGDAYGPTISATAGEVGYTTLDLNETTNLMFDCEDIMYNKEPLKYALADAPGVALVRLRASALVSS